MITRFLNLREWSPLVLRMLPVMVFSSALAMVLLVLRIERTSSFSFLFLVWNLFLAWIPFGVSLAFRKEIAMQWWARGGLFIVWLLFFPNAPYILTDLIHLKQRAGVPLWYDLMLILAFAWSGLMLGFASLHNVHVFIRETLGWMKAWAVVIALLGSCGFGIYLGRFLRWNTWDILMNPGDVLRDSLDIIVHPFANIQPIGFTLIFSLFLVVSYLTLLVLIKPDEKRAG
jgi:uncharacterized membrane protein